MAKSIDNRDEALQSSKRTPTIAFSGLRFPNSPLFKQELIEKAFKFRPRSKQVVLSSYPKCDSKLLEIILWRLVYPQNHRLPLDEITNRCLTCMEMIGSGDSSKQRPTRIVKTYLPLTEITFQKNVKYIYVIRNPWEACVSYYRLLEGDNFGQFDDFFADFVAGDVGYGSFFTHISKWQAMADEPNVLILFHENIRHNLRSTVYTVAAFLGEGYLGMLTHDDSFLIDVLDATAWDKRQLSRLAKDNQILLNTMITEPLYSVNEVLWKKRHHRHTCSAEQFKVLAEAIARKMKKTNIEHLWQGLLQKELLMLPP